MDDRPYRSLLDTRTRRLVVSGSVDELVQEQFAADLAAAAVDPDGSPHPDPLVIDLSDVDYFPSLAVSALVSLLRTQRDRGQTSAEIVAAEDSVAQRVLSICAIPHRLRGDDDANRAPEAT